MTYEDRTADLWPEDMEMRATEDGPEDGLVIEGYALKFSVPSLPLRFPGVNRGKPFVEILEPSSATRSVNSQPKLTLLYQHNMLGLPFASTKSHGEIGRMSLRLDDTGLWQRAVGRDNALNRAMYDAVKDGLVDGMSFRFDRPQDNVRSDGTFPIENVGGYGEIHVRRIREFRLYKELSLTGEPAYPDTAAYARALAEEIDADPDELAGAFRVLRDPDGKLTSPQRDLLIEVANAHSEHPVAKTEVLALAQKRERLDALAKA